MIAIDTNVLLRYLLGDDITQSKQASKLILGSTEVLVTDVVLTGTIWTLAGKRYKLKKAQILNVIQALIVEPSLRFEDEQTVWRALRDYKKTSADFADALIVNKARLVANNLGSQLQATYTFDTAALQIPGAKKP